MTLVPRCAAIAAAALLVSAPVSAAEKRYGLTSFETIDVSADVMVEVVTRAPVSAVATGPQDALDRLSVEARDGKLVISERQFAGDEKRRAPRGPVIVRVNAANLRAATLSGAGSLQIDRLKGQRAMVGLRGPGRLTVGQIGTDRLQVAMIGNGTGKCAFFVSEKLTLQQVRWNRAAVNGNKRAIAPLRAIMYRLSHQLLATATFTSNEHTHICRGN